MTTVFGNPKFGIFVAVTHILVCCLVPCYIVRELNVTADQYKKMDREDKRAFMLLLVLLLTCVVKIIMGFILIAGICKKNHHLMAPWIATTFITLVTVFFYTLVAMCSSLINQLTFKQNAVRVLSGLAILIVQMSFLYPIYVLYKSVLVIHLKREGIYEGPQESKKDSDSDLVDPNDLY
ncbi:uncharacterized protein LOC142238796 [Haematobia irritans]|uniref:uncharacterized protein LOC142238796 n=1 Tax=Haematobia irritans TaxID=7368 RepID=UPI003F503F24